MGAIGFVTLRRLARQWRALVAAGVLLGIGFGLCLAGLATARRTASAYDRVLSAARAPDAAVALGASPEAGERSLRSIAGITDQRVYAGFLGTAAGLDPALSTALIAPIRDPFPIELPRLRAGRLPDPRAPDEAIVNTAAASGGDLHVGRRLRFRLVNPLTSATTEADVDIVGIGTFPADIVADQTQVLGLFVFTRGFYEAHRDFAVYAVSNVDLAPGFDARRDLAPAIGALGYQLQSARTQEQTTVSDALRPLVIVLVAIGVLALGAAVVASGQVVVRTRDRWQADNDRLRTLGMARSQIVLVELATAGVVAGFAVATALGTMLLASPLAPIGPLHDLDPGQGYGIDGTVAAAGAVVVVATVLLLAVAFSSVRSRVLRPSLRRSPWLAELPESPATVAGITLALRTDDGRGRGWRAVAAATAAAAGVALCATFVTSAIALIDTPADYGFDAQLIALNPYGDQAEAAVQHAFGERDDVLAATGFTAGSFLVDGRAVPGLAVTTVKGELTPTLLHGRPARADDEIVVGADTLESIGARVGDVVPVTLLTGTDGEGAARRLPLRIVGVATFPPVNQLGTDMPRLGVGVLVTRAAFLRMGGNPDNQPEFTTVRLADGAKPGQVIAANADGFRDAAQSATSWFTDTKPAELLQLDAAERYLRGALVVGFAILIAILVHALFTRVRANRRDLAVLQVIGCTRRQLNAITAWQAAPFVLGMVVLGIPLGIGLGRFAFTRFAQSLAVVDEATISMALVVALVAAVLVAAAVADVVAVAVTRRSRAATVLREG